MKRVSATAGSLIGRVGGRPGGASSPSVWLRDNVREDRDPHSGQRLVDIVDLPDATADPLGRGARRDGARRMGGRDAPRRIRPRLVGIAVG